ncbi:LytTR family transcriptional regulator [Candidatus Saccharibacteria bacterium]|nr:LytTR family transcriptional regulator [Candidatus Saccharibacteria bacterium]
MKIRIETDDSLDEPEIIIRSPKLNGDVAKVQVAILDALTKNRKLPFMQGGKEYYLTPDSILFFEAVDGKTYAHTPANVYETRQKLYELEDILPSSFVRAGKSVVIGTKYILAISRNLTGPSTVQFRGSHKQINVSRGYFKQLKDKLNERV